MLLATWIFAPPQAGEKDERRFEKRNLCSRVPRLRFHVAVFWSHAKSSAVLGGTLGENAAWCSGHGSSAQEDGCGLSPAAGPARHVVLCGHRSVFSSPPHICFHEPSEGCRERWQDREGERKGGRERPHTRKQSRGKGDRKEKGTRENTLHVSAKPWLRRSSDHKCKMKPNRSG